MDQLPAIIPMLAIPNADEAINWYLRAFDAQELFRLTQPDGVIGHAELKVAGGLIMLADENPQYNASPMTVGATTVILNVRVADADAFVVRAVDAGATVIIPVNDQFYGERSGRIQDPYGYQWVVSQQIEKVSPEEMQQRFHALFEESAETAS